eukprot:jgi/Tetstr1/461471/TSEL_006578.t1
MQSVDMMQGLSHALLDDFPSGGFAPGAPNYPGGAAVFSQPPQPAKPDSCPGMMDDHAMEFQQMVEQSVQNGKLNDQLLLMPAAQSMMDLSFDGLLQMFQADTGMLEDIELPEEWMAVEPTPVLVPNPPNGMPPPSPTLSGTATTRTPGVSATGQSFNASCEDCQSSPARHMLLTSEISSAQQSFMQQSMAAAAAAAAPAPTSTPTPAPTPATQPATPQSSDPRSSTGGIASQMSAMFRTMASAKQTNQRIDAELEEKLGIKVPNTNVVTETCDKHGRQMLEETLYELEKERAFLSRGIQDEVSSSAGPKTGFMAKLSALAQPLGQRLGGLSKGKAAAGKGRVRPKDHLEALEHQHSHLQQMKTDLEEHIHKRSAVVDRMDGLLNMKTQIMEEVKMENVSLDSQLQESWLLKLGNSLEGLSMEERAKTTSLPALFLGDGYANMAVVDSLMETWRGSVQRLSELMSESAKATGQDKVDIDSRIEMQVRNVYNHIVSTCAPTAGTAMATFIQRCWKEAEQMNPNFLEAKFEAIHSAIKFNSSQLKKLLALNKIFTSKMVELVAEKVKIFHEMMTDTQDTRHDFVGRCKELQKVDTRINKLRLINISILENRLLFNFTMFRKVFTHWQLGMCIITCYPMLPEPQFLSCAVLGVKDLRNVPASTWKEAFLADD